jgi:GNAT superfamily N-acetyltransferase
VPSGGPLCAPEPLADRHLIDDFRCTEPELERWLKQRARRNQLEGASRTFVVCQGLRVAGYYCLAAGAVAHAAAPGNIRRNMPDPVPVMVLGRLAVDAGWAGRGVGRGLLKDAILRTVRAAGEAGVRALLAHAISPAAKAFYLKNGFRESPIEPLTVMLNVAALASF